MENDHHPIRLWNAGQFARKTRFQAEIDIDRFYPFYYNRLPEIEKCDAQCCAYANITEELGRFLTHPEKPMILAVGRPDPDENIEGLIRAYGEDIQLQAMANLVIFAGSRCAITEMEEKQREALTRILLLRDKYDLYGHMAVPKKLDEKYEIPELYRIAAERKGVFVDPAVNGASRKSLIQASACGLPVITARRIGAQEIVRKCKNGLVANSTDPRKLAKAIKSIIASPRTWQRFSENGVLNIRREYTLNADLNRFPKESTFVIQKTHRTGTAGFRRPETEIHPALLNSKPDAKMDSKTDSKSDSKIETGTSAKTAN